MFITCHSHLAIVLSTLWSLGYLRLFFMPLTRLVKLLMVWKANNSSLLMCWWCGMIYERLFEVTLEWTINVYLHLFYSLWRNYLTHSKPLRSGGKYLLWFIRIEQRQRSLGVLCYLLIMIVNHRCSRKTFVAIELEKIPHLTHNFRSNRLNSDVTYIDMENQLLLR